jgi:hypothetical protein
MKSLPGPEHERIDDRFVQLHIVRKVKPQRSHNGSLRCAHAATMYQLGFNAQSARPVCACVWDDQPQASSLTPNMDAFLASSRTYGYSASRSRMDLVIEASACGPKLHGSLVGREPCCVSLSGETRRNRLGGRGGGAAGRMDATTDHTHRAIERAHGTELVPSGCQLGSSQATEAAHIATPKRDPRQARREPNDDLCTELLPAALNVAGPQCNTMRCGASPVRPHQSHHPSQRCWAGRPPRSTHHTLRLRMSGDVPPSITLPSAKVRGQRFPVRPRRHHVSVRLQCAISSASVRVRHTGALNAFTGNNSESSQPHGSATQTALRCVHLPSPCHSTCTRHHSY